jgi:hypothetical protein
MTVASRLSSVLGHLGGGATSDTFSKHPNDGECTSHLTAGPEFKMLRQPLLSWSSGLLYVSRQVWKGLC